MVQPKVPKSTFFKKMSVFRKKNVFWNRTLLTRSTVLTVLSLVISDITSLIYLHRYALFWVKFHLTKSVADNFCNAIKIMPAVAQTAIVVSNCGRVAPLRVLIEFLARTKKGKLKGQTFYWWIIWATILNTQNGQGFLDTLPQKGQTLSITMITLRPPF